MPSRPVQALLAVEPGVDAEDVKDSLPGGEDFNVVAVVTGAEEAMSWLRGGVADLLLVACAGYSDRALLLLDGVARQNPELNVMVLGPRVAQRLPQARVRGRRRRHRHAPGDAGADPLRDPQAHGPQAGCGDAAAERELAARLRPRPEGRHRQDADVDEPLGEPRAARREGRAHRPRPPVRRRRAVPRPAAGEDGVRPRPVAGRARLGQAPGVHGAPLVRRAHADRAATPRSGERRRSRAPARDLRDPAPELRLGRRRHAAGLHGRGHHVDRPLDGHRHGRDARLALAEEHEARARDPRAHEVRPRPHLPAPEPRAQPRRDQPVGRRGGAGTNARRLHPVRPRDPAHGERGNPDRRRAAAVGAGRGLRSPDDAAQGLRARRRAASPRMAAVAAADSSPLPPPPAVGSSDERAKSWNSTSESRASAAPSENRSRSPSSRTACT